MPEPSLIIQITTVTSNSPASIVTTEELITIVITATESNMRTRVSPQAAPQCHVQPQTVAQNQHPDCKSLNP